MTLIDNLRDRLAAAQPRPVDAMPIEPVGWQAHQEGVDKPVSYTHLTLPTICSV